MHSIELLCWCIISFGVLEISADKVSPIGFSVGAELQAPIPAWWIYTMGEDLLTEMYSKYPTEDDIKHQVRQSSLRFNGLTFNTIPTRQMQFFKFAVLQSRQATTNEMWLFGPVYCDELYWGDACGTEMYGAGRSQWYKTMFLPWVLPYPNDQYSTPSWLVLRQDWHWQHPFVYSFIQRSTLQNVRFQNTLHEVPAEALEIFPSWYPEYLAHPFGDVMDKAATLNPDGTCISKEDKAWYRICPPTRYGDGDYDFFGFPDYGKCYCRICPKGYMCPDMKNAFRCDRTDVEGGVNIASWTGFQPEYGKTHCELPGDDQFVLQGSRELGSSIQGTCNDDRNDAWGVAKADITMYASNGVADGPEAYDHHRYNEGAYTGIAVAGFGNRFWLKLDYNNFKGFASTEVPYLWRNWEKVAATKGPYAEGGIFFQDGVVYQPAPSETPWLPDVLNPAGMKNYLGQACFDCWLVEDKSYFNNDEKQQKVQFTEEVGSSWDPFVYKYTEELTFMTHPLNVFTGKAKTRIGECAQHNEGWGMEYSDVLTYGECDDYTETKGFIHTNDMQGALVNVLPRNELGNDNVTPSRVEKIGREEFCKPCRPGWGIKILAGGSRRDHTTPAYEKNPYKIGSLTFNDIHYSVRNGRKRQGSKFERCDNGKYSKLNEAGHRVCEPAPRGYVAEELARNRVYIDMGICAEDDPETDAETCKSLHKCQGHTYADVDGLTTCKPCPGVVIKINTLATGCSLCDVNEVVLQIPSTRRRECAYCKLNHVKALKIYDGSSADTTPEHECQPCQGGFVRRINASDPVEGNTCVACAAGKVGGYNFGDSSPDCGDCEPQHFTSKPNMTKCETCEHQNIFGNTNSYVNSENTACMQCPTLERSAEVMPDSLQPCKCTEGGTYRNSSEICVLVEEGFFAYEGIRQHCESPFISWRKGSSNCEEACGKTNTYEWVNRDGVITRVRKYTYRADSNTSCVTCEAGFSCTNGVLERCPAGTFQDTTWGDPCTPCVNEDYCPYAGMQAPLKCLDGATSGPNENQNQFCSVCPELHYSSKGSCTPCQGCRYGNYISEACTLTHSDECKPCITACDPGSSLTPAQSHCSARCDLDTTVVATNRIESGCHDFGTPAGRPENIRMRDFQDTRTCEHCESVCDVGFFVEKLCGDSNAEATCQQCNNLICSRGEYMHHRCSGEAYVDDRTLTTSAQDNDCRACRTNCSTGYYISDDTCDPAGSLNTQCSLCKTFCAVGEYLQGICDGTSKTDTITCVSCNAECTGETYREGNPCDGTGTTPMFCKDCLQRNTTHPMGCADPTKRFVGQCDGKGSSDTARCEDACEPCGSKQYRLGAGCNSNCNDCDQQQDAQGNSQLACLPDQFIAATCDGTTSSNLECESCRKETNTTVNSAARCNLGSRLQNQCSGFDQWDSSFCVTCGWCNKGQYMHKDCQGFGDSALQCAPCKTECAPDETFYNECQGDRSVDTTGCITCDFQACDKGHYFTHPCDNKTCIACAPCQIDEYKSYNCDGYGSVALVKYEDARGLFRDNACTKCNQECGIDEYLRVGCDAVHNGTLEYDANVCIPCDPCSNGYYASTRCSDSRAKGYEYTTVGVDQMASDLTCTRCTQAHECATDEWLQGECGIPEQPPVCTACRSCGFQQRQVVGGACTDHTDTQCESDITCYTDCPVGHYVSQDCDSQNSRNCTLCQTCLAGEYISLECKVGGTHDTVCLPCISQHGLCATGENSHFGDCTGQTDFDAVQCNQDSEVALSQDCPANWFAHDDYTTLNGETVHATANGLHNWYTMAIHSTESHQVYATVLNEVVSVYNMVAAHAHVNPHAPIFTKTLTSASYHWGTTSSVTFDYSGNFLFLTHGTALHAFDLVLRCDIYGSESGDCKPHLGTRITLRPFADQSPPLQACVLTPVFSTVSPVYLLCVLSGLLQTNSEAVARIRLIHTTVSGVDGEDRTKAGIAELIDANLLGTELTPPTVLRTYFTSKPVIQASASAWHVYVMATTFNVTNQTFSFGNTYELRRYTLPTDYGLESLALSQHQAQSGNFEILYAAAGPVTQVQFRSLVFRQDRNEIIAMGSTPTGYRLYEFNVATLAVGLAHEGPFTQLLLQENPLPKQWNHMWFSMATINVAGGATQIYVADFRTKHVHMYTHCAKCGLDSTSPSGSVGSQSCTCNSTAYYDSTKGHCQACKNGLEPCAAGMHATGLQCQGNDAFDVSCAACRTECPAGEYMQGSCNAAALTDEMVCTTCRTSCPAAPLFAPDCPTDCVSGTDLWYRFDGTGLHTDSSSRHVDLWNGAGNGVFADFQHVHSGVSSVHFSSAVPLAYLGRTTFDEWQKYRGVALVMWVRLGTDAGGPIYWIGDSNSKFQVTEYLMFHVDAAGLQLATQSVTYDLPTPISQQNWYQVGFIATRNSSSSVQDNWQWILDGNTIPINPIPSALKLPAITMRHLFLGRDVHTDRYFHGNLDDLRFFHRPLGLLEIQALYTKDDCCGEISGYTIGNDICTGQSHNDTTDCLACESDCGVGNYISEFSSRCQGDSLTDTLFCMPCQPCEPGFYLDGGCPGTGYVDNVNCKPCTHTSCVAGLSLVAPCTGFTVEDTAECRECNGEVGCTENWFIRGLSQPAEACLNGPNDYVCQQCVGALNCQASRHVQHKCTGNTYTDESCVACTTECAPGFYLDGTCDMESEHDTVTCTPCTQCAPGFFATESCSGLNHHDVVECTQCESKCAPEHYLIGDCDLSLRSCVACTPTCNLGYEESTACTNTTNRVCSEIVSCEDDCPATYFQSAVCIPGNPKICTQCGECASGQYVSQRCSATSPTLCSDCHSTCGLHDLTNSVIGNCDTGGHHFDRVQCTSVSTSLANPTTNNFYRVNQSTPLLRDVFGVAALEMSSTSQYAMLRFPIYQVDGNRSVAGRYVHILNMLDATVYTRTNFVNIVPESHEIYQTLVHPGDAVLYILYGHNTNMLIQACSLVESYITDMQCQNIHTPVTGKHQGCVGINQQDLVCAFVVSELVQFQWVARNGVNPAYQTDYTKLLSAPILRDQHQMWFLAVASGVPQLTMLDLNERTTTRYWTPPNDASWLFPSPPREPRFEPLVFLPVTKDLVFGVADTNRIYIWQADESYDTAAELVLDQVHSTVGNLGAKLVLADAREGILMYTHAAPCPPNSTSKHNSTTLQHCECVGDTYGTIANISDQCHPCSDILCPLDTHRQGGPQCNGMGTTCAPCMQTCGTGQYLANRCTGNSPSATAECVSCNTTCPIGTYQSNPCDGTTYSDVSQCIPCRTQCPKKYKLEGICDGQSQTDVVTCKPCQNCNRSQTYLTMCNGLGYHDTQLSTCTNDAFLSCDENHTLFDASNGDKEHIRDSSWCVLKTNCAAECSAGYRIAGPAGFVCNASNQDFYCAPCATTCNSNEYISGPCSGMSRSFLGCSRCILECAIGEYLQNQCDGTATSDTSSCVSCQACDAGYYRSSTCTGTTNYDAGCISCTQTCPVGQYLKGDCTQDTSPVCTDCQNSCPEGSGLLGTCTGNTHYDTTTCVPCANCQKNTYKSSSTTCMESNCETCQSQCAPGEYRYGSCDGTSYTDDTQCVPCTQCHLTSSDYTAIHGQCLGDGRIDNVTCTVQNSLDCDDDIIATTHPISNSDRNYTYLRLTRDFTYAYRCRVGGNFRSVCSLLQWAGELESTAIIPDIEAWYRRDQNLEIEIIDWNSAVFLANNSLIVPVTLNQHPRVLQLEVVDNQLTNVGTTAVSGPYCVEHTTDPECRSDPTVQLSSNTYLVATPSQLEVSAYGLLGQAYALLGTKTMAYHYLNPTPLRVYILAQTSPTPTLVRYDHQLDSFTTLNLPVATQWLNLVILGRSNQDSVRLGLFSPTGVLELYSRCLVCQPNSQKLSGTCECDEGFYADGAICVPCRRPDEACPLHHFQSNQTCHVGSTTDVSCEPCTECQYPQLPGVSQCTGHTAHDTVQCKDCTVCEAGAFALGKCTDTYDVSTCVSCTTVCAPQQYLDASQPCESSLTSQQDQGCLECDGCDSDSYIQQNNCNGLTYSSTPPTCAPCRSDACPAGHYWNQTACTVTSATLAEICPVCSLALCHTQVPPAFRTVNCSSTTNQVCHPCNSTLVCGPQEMKIPCTETADAYCKPCQTLQDVPANHYLCTSQSLDPTNRKFYNPACNGNTCSPTSDNFIMQCTSACQSSWDTAYPCTTENNVVCIPSVGTRISSSSSSASSSSSSSSSSSIDGTITIPLLQHTVIRQLEGPPGYSPPIPPCFGSDTQLAVGLVAQQAALLKFNFSTIPTNVQVQRVYLQLGFEPLGEDPVSITVSEIPYPWTSTTTDWQAASTDVLINTDLLATDNPTNIDIKQLWNYWKENANYGLRLGTHMSASTECITFQSSTVLQLKYILLEGQSFRI